MQQQLEHYFDRLWSLNRSLTGEGNRESLRILSELVDLKVHEIPSGTACFDWNIPPEWNAHEAWIKDPNGNIVVDFRENNLHLLGYSTPIHAKMSLAELKPHLYSLPDNPDWIPYRTSYYKERWGFCLTHNLLISLPDGEYEVFIDSTLDKNGSMTIADAVIEGETEEEIMFSTYICHPSMANNELSGPLVQAFLYQAIKALGKTRYTYRFAFLPETIGAIYYLSQHGEHLKEKLRAGYVLNCIGDAGKFTYKRSRQLTSLADRAAETVLAQTKIGCHAEDFFPLGSDERQYCSPHFDLPMGSVMRTRYYNYPEYHTSADNKDFISFEAMETSVLRLLDIIKLLEVNAYYVNQMPHCEPQLGKRGLYPNLGSDTSTRLRVGAMMWTLNLADGKHDLIDIVRRSGQPVSEILEVVKTLTEHGLLVRT